MMPTPPPPPPHFPHSQKRTLQTAFFPQLSAYCINLNTGYRKLCKKINLFLFLLFPSIITENVVLLSWKKRNR